MLSQDLTDPLWDRLYVAVPQQLRWSIERHKLVKRANVLAQRYGQKELLLAGLTSLPMRLERIAINRHRRMSDYPSEASRERND